VNTFFHSIAWHAGTSFAHMLGFPVALVFIGYAVYRFIKK